MTQNYDSASDNLLIDLGGKFSDSGLIYLGLDELAYVKKMVEDGEHIFGIFAADGEQIGMAPEFELARAMVIQNELFPVNVH